MSNKITNGQYFTGQLSKQNLDLIRKFNLNFDSETLAGIWPDFVNFEKRRQKEIPFLLSQLEEYDNPKVFDSCLGSGATSIGLLLEGVDVVSNETDEDLVKIAKKQAKFLGDKLDIRNYDWRELDFKNEFDMVTCLGNSLTYLFRRDEQLRVLRNFRRMLKPGGKLVMDERNYEEFFLKENAEFRYSGEVVYCGKEKVHAHPIHSSLSMVIMEYEHLETREKAHLVFYPFKNGEMASIIAEAGFKKIEKFGDYKQDFDRTQAEFFTYVAKS